MSIVSNLCPERVVKSSFKIPVNFLKSDKFSGLQIAQRIIKVNNIAKSNIFRACTHNKGIMNGISALCLAIG